MNAKTKLYGLIGHPVKHSLSPLFQNRLIEMHDLNACYLAFDIQPDRLDTVLTAMETLGIEGINVTVPYKEKIIPFLDHLDESARSIQAVNTICRVDGEWIGYNTDVLGFGKLLDTHGISPENMIAKVIGAGGAARAVLHALDMRGFTDVTVINRTEEKARNMLADLKLESVRVQGISEYQPGPGHLIINTTPVGLKIGESPIVIDHPLKDAWLVDIIYNPAETTLMKMARDNGIPALNGLSMLLLQGIRSFELWHDLEVKPDIVDALIKETEKAMEEVK